MSTMRPGTQPRPAGTLISLLFLAVALVAAPGRADEPGGGLFSRLFRGSNASAPAARTNAPVPPTSEAPTTVESEPRRPSNPGASGSASEPPRIVPQPRVSRAVTDADPIVTRVGLGRSDDGTQFAMFLQVYSDGTVIDSEGVHRLPREDLRGVIEAAGQADLFRSRGHCGAAATDFLEQVYVVVYERNLGRLRANAFSYSGNTQGCDRPVQKLQAALDGLQAKLARPASPSAAAVPSTTPVHTSASPVHLNGAPPLPAASLPR
jgi:hypothetical protein